MSHLQASIIGLGVGERHISACQTHLASEARLICDTDAEKLVEVSRRRTGCAKGDLIGKFFDEITGEGSMEITPEEVFRTMAVCFAAEESLNTGQAVAVEPIPERML